MAFFALLLVASILGEKVGVPVWLDVDPYTVHYGRGAEVERDSITTAYGWGMIVLSVLAAVATWHVEESRPPPMAARTSSDFFLAALF